MTTKTILFASLVAAAMLTLIGFSTVSAGEADEVAENAQKIEQFKERALADGQVPTSEILDRLDEQWVEQYDDSDHFETTEDAIHTFINRNVEDENDWDSTNAMLHLEIQNFETIIGVVGHGHELTLHVAELAKLQGKYDPSEPVSKYHEWLATMYDVPKTEKEITASLVKILGDEKYIELAVRHAENFDRLAGNGSPPIDLIMTDVQYWIFIANVANCDLAPDCDADALRNGQTATEEQIAEATRISEEADTTFNPFDYILPKAYAWSKVQVDYTLHAYLSATSCYYLNCIEEWFRYNENGSGEIDVTDYDTPPEHARRGALMYFFGSACDTYSGSETVINEVEMTPYLAQQLRPQYTDDGLNINACATAYKYITATHPWILGIHVESPGSHYWVE